MRNAITARFGRNLTFRNYADYYRYVRLRQMGITGAFGQILYPRLAKAYAHIVDHHLVRGRDPVESAEAFLWAAARHRDRAGFARYFTS